MALDRDEDGAFQAAFGPAEQHSEDRTIRTAKGLASKHADIIAWLCEANPKISEQGDPTVPVPDMD